MSTKPDALVQNLRDVLANERGDSELIETHISWVLLAGPYAYKIKKPVRLSFLDFSTLALRQRYCIEELELNRRFAPALYIDVVPICGSAEAPRFGGAGPAIEYAVRMHRMRDDDLAVTRAARGALGAGEIERFAARLAALHDRAPVAPADGAFGTPERVAADITQLLAAWPHVDDADAVDDLRRWFDGQLHGLAATLAQRLSAGRVRECHGDLHLDNLAFVQGELTPFDGLEFDAALRWTDVMADVAFLAMDLQMRQRHDLAHAFTDAYLEAGGDYAGVPVLRLYKVYRAVVRARVARLREAGSASRARASVSADYLALAQRLARQWDPRLLITQGLPGSGKTWVTHALIESTGAVRLRSDVERARLLGPDHYQPDDSAAVYRRLLELVRLSLQAGHPTIVDAAFLLRRQRDPFHALAAELKVPFVLLHCTASLELLRQRVRARMARGGDASQADEAVLQRLQPTQQPPAADEAIHTLQLDTEQPLSGATLAAAWLAAPRPF